MYFPVQGGGKFTNDWGAPRSGGRKHRGTDIFAPRGTPVVAIEDGVVSRVGWNDLGGNRLWLNGKWYYAHLDRYAPGITEGSSVKAGQVLGYVGDTGDAKGTPPHLHLGYNPRGDYGNSWENPYSLLKSLKPGKPEALERPPPEQPPLGEPPSAVEPPQIPTDEVLPEETPLEAISGITGVNFNYSFPVPLGGQSVTSGLVVPGAMPFRDLPFDPPSIWRQMSSLPLASEETLAFASML
jgi:murein DD-endopeptidase MepM/ murein hydrolase activator NlpD